MKVLANVHEVQAQSELVSGLMTESSSNFTSQS